MKVYGKNSAIYQKILWVKSLTMSWWFPQGQHQNTQALLRLLGGNLWGPFQLGRQGGPGGWRIIDEPEIHFKNPPQKTEKENVVVPDIAGWKKKSS